MEVVEVPWEPRGFGCRERFRDGGYRSQWVRHCPYPLRRPVVESLFLSKWEMGDLYLVRKVPSKIFRTSSLDGPGRGRYVVVGWNGPY